MKETNPGALGGGGQIVEADETYIGRTDVARKRGKKSRGGRDKMKVVSLVERGGNVRSFKVGHVNSKTVQDVLFRNVDRKSHLMTDEAAYYKQPGEDFARHQSVNHSRYEYVRGEVSTNTIEGYFSIFKRGMKGVYQHCGEKHLQRYLTEFDFRYNTRKITDAERRDKALEGIEGKRLTYRRISLRAHQQA